MDIAQSPIHFLVAPLNWGLGHASRCIPIIEYLLSLNAKVTIASDGEALKLLEHEFPALPTVELPSYNIEYGTGSFAKAMLSQIPKIFNAIKKERQFIRSWSKENPIDIVFSDNRYGVHIEQAQNIFLTHQVNPIVPIKFVESITQKSIHRLINRFDACWIPDFQSQELAGKLSTNNLNIPVSYIGSLSRMKKYDRNRKYKIAAVLSGPEPQRSILEEELKPKLAELDAKSIIIRGLPSLNEHYHINDNVEVVSFLTKRALNDVIMESEILISRSGYSTIMDLIQLESKALLVPTPLQSEQEYLAKTLSDRGIFITQEQGKINLLKGIQAIENQTLHFPNNNENIMKEKIYAILKNR